MENVVNAAPYVGVISQLIMWCGLLFSLMMFRGWITTGVSWAVAEWLMKNADDPGRERFLKWLGDPDKVGDRLDEIIEQNKEILKKKENKND